MAEAVELHYSSRAIQVISWVGPDMSHRLLSAARQNLNGIAGNFATRLRYVSARLLEQEVDAFSPNAQSLALETLRDLVTIFHWSESANIDIHHDNLVELLHQRLLRRLGEEWNEWGIQAVQRFCKEPSGVLHGFLLRLNQFLLAVLTDNQVGLQDATVDLSDYSEFKPPQKRTYPDEINRLLVDGIKRNSLCRSGGRTDTTQRWHNTRLGLESGYRQSADLVAFDVIASTPDQTYCLDMVINIPIASRHVKWGDHAGQQHPGGLVDQPNAACPYFCARLADPLYARLYVDLDEEYNMVERQDVEPLEHITSGHTIKLSDFLSRSKLEIKHKIKLSYSIALAFWQFYSSDLMESQWTSDDIFFVTMDSDHRAEQRAPLRAFVSFPFDPDAKPAPPEFCEFEPYAHRYPRILYLGIVLLEIGLGCSLELRQNKRLKPYANMNAALSVARTQLRELKQARWDNFRWKSYFTEAVESCLQQANFKHNAMSTIDSQPEHRDRSIDAQKGGAFVERKDAIYQRVVAPLRWLATVGFQEDPEVHPSIELCAAVRENPLLDESSLPKSFWNEKTDEVSLPLDGPNDNYLDGFGRLAEHVMRCQNKARISERVRIAIIDTGCLTEFSFFQEPARSARIKAWKDFTPEVAPLATDVCGHGTLMARLIMQIAPMVDIYVLRVATSIRDLNDYEDCGVMIAEAIEHAGLHPDWRVDVISMAFGFTHKRGARFKAMSDAIEKVCRERDESVILLASAGNSPKRSKAFPASSPHVITIHATDSKGAFLGSNCSQGRNGPKRLGVYGADLPKLIRTKLQKQFPELSMQGGTSIATAIAAGSIGLMLSYVAALPSLLDYSRCEEPCRFMYTTTGMKQLLVVMSSCNNDQDYFLNLFWFWGDRKSDWDVFCSICSAVEEMHKEI